MGGRKVEANEKLKGVEPSASIVHSRHAFPIDQPTQYIFQWAIVH